MDGVYIPFFRRDYFGDIFHPIFVFVMTAIFTGGVIDGLDGLSGGIFVAIFVLTAVSLIFKSDRLGGFCG